MSDAPIGARTSVGARPPGSARTGRPRLRYGLGIVLGVATAYLGLGAPTSRALHLHLPLAGVRAVRAEAPREPAATVIAPAPASSAALTTVATLPEARAPAPREASCPEDMVFIHGDYCTRVEHDCKRWLDDTLLPFARCAEYVPPARCVGKRVPMNFCIDRYEYTPPGQDLPQNYASFIEAGKICEKLGRRVCSESEWNFACEGEEMLPYPYGWLRQPVCNQDRTDLFEPNAFVRAPSAGPEAADREVQVLKDHRQPSLALPACRSPFGVFNMVGNLDEPVLREAQRYAYPFRNGLKGGWWMAGRNRCRPATTAHDDHYRDIQIGVRCCRDLKPADGSAPRNTQQ